jgi:hypothetical protein
MVDFLIFLTISHLLHFLEKEIAKTNNKQSIIEPIQKSFPTRMSKTTARTISLFKNVIEVAIKRKNQIVICSRKLKIS